MLQDLRKYYLVTKGIIEARKIWALVRKDEYDRISAELQDLLIRSWNDATTEAIRDVIRAVNNREAFTEEALDQMIAQLRVRLGPSFANDVAADMLELQTSSYVAGMEGILAFKPTFNIVDTRALAALERYATYPVLHHFDDQLQDKIREFGKQIIEGGLNREEAGKLFMDEFAKKYNVQSFRYWEGYADHVVTRSREFGSINGMVRAEIEWAVVEAQLDHRTTEVCRHMHGRRIKVSELVIEMNRIIDNDDPEKIREIAPWPQAEQISQIKTKNLPNGAKIPGYHFACRTVLRAEREISERNTVTGSKMGKGVGRDDKKKLNSLDAGEYSNWVDTIRSKRRMGFDPDTLDKNLAQYAGSLGIAEDADEYLKAGRGIIRNANGIIAKVNNTPDGKRQFEFHFFSDAGTAVVGDDLQFHSIRGLDNPAGSFAGSLSNGLRLKGSWED